MIVAQAGRKGAVTVATNMAGRGVDILLGGNPEYLARQEMAARDWDNDAYLLFEMDEEERAAYEAEYEPILAEVQGADRRRARRGRRAGRALRAGHRAARVATDRQPAAWPFRPPGRPGRVALLPLARGRPDADVRERPGRLDHGAAEVARRRGDRGQDGHPRRRERAEADRGAQLRAPQERPEVRRRDERPARGDLRRAPRDPRGPRPRRTRRSRWSRRSWATRSTAHCPPDVFPEDWDLDALYTALLEIYPVQMPRGAGRPTSATARARGAVHRGRAGGVRREGGSR